MSTDLDQLTDRDLSNVFAVEVAGWTCDVLNRFATSADDVLPYLHPHLFTVGRLFRGDGDNIDAAAPMTYVVTIYHGGTCGNGAAGKAESNTFARAACIALLRAKRAKAQN
jgi:hypothetical protein